MKQNSVIYFHYLVNKNMSKGCLQSFWKNTRKESRKLLNDMDEVVKNLKQRRANCSEVLSLCMGT